ncbi:hypothetical protein [Staphylococcus saprophyticus]|uniref:hypothetical protein n=1 Tax=Staphylococcus saprophyticus TaxID=29385 RepID=UPI000661721A|nr:hypothetical protein [Staphylococcus saprophyticus]AMG33646.1 hypothetical protein AL494_07740 [Staphylococcus saprophyticus]MBF2780693.1 hypothetical protein [Staphylococcus saprophyticus]MDW3837918.1 hypothetical protein [Staphylococcus saprophyticus]MDW4061944.1 hypothetical protein [Staphylococcus saprophyticus]MDW4103989.1 hypothetical protein [Staphylococcus saprophyticus]
MSKSFLIAFAMWVVSTLLISILTANAVIGLGWGVMLGILTYVFFEYMFYDEKKTASNGNC